MIAKIVDKDRREYYSTVFAICENGWDTAVIVYDDEKHKFSFRIIVSSIVLSVFFAEFFIVIINDIGSRKDEKKEILFSNGRKRNNRIF